MPDDFNGRWFRLNAYNDELRRFVFQAEMWIRGCLVNRSGLPRLLPIAGANGIGKTAVLQGMHRYARAAYIDAWEKGCWGSAPPSIKYAAWCRVDDVDPRKEPECWDELTETSILFLDDVGAERDRFKSDESLELLALLLGARLHKWTALTTNFLPDQWPARFGKRVTDRLYRDASPLALRQTHSWSMRKVKA